MGTLHGRPLAGRRDQRARVSSRGGREGRRTPVRKKPGESEGASFTPHAPRRPTNQPACAASFISKFGIKNEESAIGSTPFTNARTGPFAGSEHIKGVLPAGGMKRAGLDAQDYLDSMTDKEAEEARKRAQEAGSKDAFYAAK